MLNPDLSFLFTISNPTTTTTLSVVSLPLVLNDGQPRESRSRSESSPKIKIKLDVGSDLIGFQICEGLRLCGFRIRVGAAVLVSETVCPNTYPCGLSTSSTVDLGSGPWFSLPDWLKGPGEDTYSKTLGDLGNVKPAMLLPTGEAILFYYLYIWIWCCIAWLYRLIPKERERDENNTCCNSKMAKNANNSELKMEKQIQLHEERPDGCGGVGFGLYDRLTFSVELCVTVIKVRRSHFLDMFLLLF
ncbi:hypothetical protein EV2_033423 [Malus domestica]